MYEGAMKVIAEFVKTWNCAKSDDNEELGSSTCKTQAPEPL